MPRQVEFFFDVVSPTAYLAHKRLPAIVQRTGATLVHRPMFLGGVMQASGNRPPGTVAAKGKWMNADLQRYAKKYDAPYVHNPHFPVNTLSAQRGLTAWLGKPEFPALLDAMFQATWRDQVNLGEKVEIARVAGLAGVDGAAFVAAAEDPVNKEKLKATTEEALARGVFGAPTFFVGDEMHFGQDRLEWVEEALRD
jgi:2-hydroxychromene-2-carboxylate isomerase